MNLTAQDMVRKRVKLEKRNSIQAVINFLNSTSANAMNGVIKDLQSDCLGLYEAENYFGAISALIRRYTTEVNDINLSLAPLIAKDDTVYVGTMTKPAKVIDVFYSSFPQEGYSGHMVM